MNTLPINGRIVIIDNSIKQALPLMKEFGKLRLSYSYYDGTPENLPQEGSSVDARLVFLDINLIDDSVHPVQQLYSMVYAVMNRLICQSNFPYMLVCWSRNTDEYNQIIEKLNHDLGNRKPICSIPLQKSDFFTLEGNPTEEFEEKIEKLFELIANALNPHTSFCNLLLWENHIHNAINYALKDGLSCINDKEWDETANWIFTKWGKAYSGKNFESLPEPEKLRAAFHTLNLFLHETIEEEIGSDADEDLHFSSDFNDRNIKISHFNERLIFTFCQTHPKEPGRIVITSEEYSDFKDILNFCFTPNPELIPESIKTQITRGENPCNSLKKYYSNIRKNIRTDWDIFKLVINAPCDYAQKKVKMSKAIPGIFVKSEFRKWFNNSSDALFISPDFYYRLKDADYFFILDFRYLTSEKEDNGKSQVKLKQVVLAEILSKLSRHINRQGLLTIE